MNILIICRCLGIGGAERVASIWANGLQKAGHHVLILTNTSSPVTYYINPQIKIISSNYDLHDSDNLIKDINKRISYVNQIKNLIDDKSIDVIIKVMHVNSIELLFAKILSKRKPPIIMTDHNTYERPVSAPMTISAKFQKFWINRYFDKVTVLTQRDKEITNRHHLQNVEVLHNPVSLIPIETENIERENIVLAVGRLDSWHVKGFDNLVKAWNVVGAKHPGWKLRIVGKGKKSTKDYLQSLSSNSEQLELAEFNENVTEEYRQAQIFVLSSRYEGWGLVLVEAMSQGCACIACDYFGRQAEIIEDHKNGILCKPDDVESLAKNIDKLISDTQLRSYLQQNAPKNIERFSEYNVTRKLLKIINRVIK